MIAYEAPKEGKCIIRKDEGHLYRSCMPENQHFSRSICEKKKKRTRQATSNIDILCLEHIAVKTNCRVKRSDPPTSKLQIHVQRLVCVEFYASNDRWDVLYLLTIFARVNKRLSDTARMNARTIEVRD